MKRRNHMGETFAAKATHRVLRTFELVKAHIEWHLCCREPYHLNRYVTEQVFRCNNRKNMTDADRFPALLSQVAAKRLTYAEVTGKVGETTF